MGTSLKYLIQLLDYSIKELSEKSGVSKENISNLINGKCKKLKLIYTTRVAEAMKLDVNFIFLYDEVLKKYSDINMKHTLIPIYALQEALDLYKRLYNKKMEIENLKK